jgi:hypothetical protein
MDALASVLQADGRRRWSLAGEPYSGDVEAVYEDGMRLATTLVDGCEHGLHRLYFRGGMRACEVPLRAGREHGRVGM